EWCWPEQSPAKNAALALLRVPKSLALFECQLAGLAARMEEGAPVLVAAMDKHAPQGLIALLERYLDDVSRDEGRKKAHVYRGRARGVANDVGALSTAFEVPGLSVALHN